jgi:hypothetical protein
MTSEGIPTDTPDGSTGFMCLEQERVKRVNKMTIIPTGKEIQNLMMCLPATDGITQVLQGFF